MGRGVGATDGWPRDFDALATGTIVSHEHCAEDGTRSYFFEWQGGPFARIAWRIWSKGLAGLVDRRANRARIGDFDLTLMERHPHYDIWYREPSPPAMQIGGAPCQR